VTDSGACSPAVLSPPKRRIWRVGIQVACLSFVVWLPCVPMLLNLKEDVLQRGGYLVVSLNLGRFHVTGSVPPTDGLKTTDRFALFLNDLVVAVVGIPLALIVLSLVLPPRYRPLAVALGSSVILLYAYVQYRCLKTVGIYQSAHALWEGLFWAAANRDLAGSYVGFTPGHLKTGATLLVVWVIAIVSARRIARNGETPLGRRFGYLFPGAMVALIGAVLTTAWATPVPQFDLYDSAFWKSVKVFWGYGEFYNRQIADMSGDDVIKEYRRLADFTAEPAASPYHGTARDCDVIWFILETAPARCLPPSDPLDEFPNLRKLAPHSLIAVHHDTTFPATLQAVSSMLTSWYPADMRLSEKLARSKQFSGLGNSLVRAGYATALYSPDPLREETKVWFGALGMQRIWSSGGVVRRRPQRDPPEERIDRDRAALKALLADLANWTKSGQRYFAIYEPQIGHGPWLPVAGAKENSDTYEKGRAIIELQDEWLGEILALLERNGRLKQTIILVTGDHGVRTAFEDSAFRSNLLDERSFHVPFYLYAPTSFREPLRIDWITSHIDIAPSILDLLGIDAGRSLEQGDPLWSSRIRDRTTYLWGGDYMGVDGFHRRGHFFSKDLLNGAVMFSEQLRSEQFRLIPATDDDRRMAAARIERMRMLMNRWVELDPNADQQSAARSHAN
jgi:Sulfatase